MKGDFQPPPHHEPLQDWLRLFGWVRAQQGLRFELAFWFPDQDPADGQRGHAAMKPNGCAGRYFNILLPLAIPIWKDDFLPMRLNIFLGRLQSRQAAALLAWPAVLSGYALRSWFIRAAPSRKRAIRVIGWASFTT